MEEIDRLAKYINMSETPISWKVAYDYIKNRIPERVEWLEEKYILDALQYYDLIKEEFKMECLKALSMIKQDRHLKVICYLWHYILFVDQTGLYKDIWRWKNWDQLYLYAGNAMLPVIVMLSGYLLHRKNMQEKKYSQIQIQEQKRNIKECCLKDREKFHIKGIRFSQMVWGAYFMKGLLIQVGRLQYEYPVMPPRILKEYALDFNAKHYVAIHIPEGKDLKEEEVLASLKNVKDELIQIYPEIEIELIKYYTYTWLFSKELDQLLLSKSNILKFKSKFDMISQSENTKDFLRFVFQTNENTDYHLLKEETSLQKKLKEELLKGTKLHIGLGVLK